MNLDSSGERGEAQVAEELTRFLGHAPAEWSAETLTHNIYNAVTAGIWWIRAGSASVVVLKVISLAGTAALQKRISSTQSADAPSLFSPPGLRRRGGLPKS